MVGMFVLITFLLFIIVDIFVLKMQNKPHPAFGMITSSNLLLFNNLNIDIPGDLLFSRSHTWLQKNHYGLIKIGVDDFIDKSLGNYSFSKFADINKDIKRGEIIFELLSGNKLIKIPSPIDGTLKFINEDLLNKKNISPYQDWGVLLAPKNYDENIRQLIFPKDTAAWMKKEVSRLKSFMKNTFQKTDLAGLTMYDGGTVVKSVISSLTDREFQDFQKEFLTL